MGQNGIPANYLDYNTQQTKNVSVVVKIAGVPDLLTNRTLNTRVRFGDPNITYGQTGLVYGGLRPYTVKNQDGSTSTFRPFLSLEGSSSTVSQRLEPEQGKASVSTLSLAFIDYQGYMSELVSPGLIIPEIMGAEVQVWLGYEEISYPDDFYMAFRGYVSSVDAGPGIVTLQISDPNIKRRQTLFYTAQTATTTSVGNTDSLINVSSNSGFFNQVLQPGELSLSSASVHTYVQIDSEWIEAVPLYQDNSGFTAYIQGNTYTARQGHGADISITYTTGGTAGSEVVTVSGTSISVQIQSGVSTAQQVNNAIRASVAAYALVTIGVFPPSAGTTQTAQTKTYLAVSTKYGRVIQGIQYTSAPGHTTDVSVTYANDGTAGAETVTIAGAAVTVHMQDGHSTAQQINTALANYYVSLAPLLGWYLLPNANLVVQQAQSATFMVGATPGTQLGVIQRGARGTSAATHASGSTVAAAIQIGDKTYNENAMDMALKVQLSGWGGPWISGVEISSIGQYPDPIPNQSTTSCIQFNVDVVDTYGLVAGDWITITGSGTVTNNNIPFQIVRFQSQNGLPNRLVFVNTSANSLAKDFSTSATVAFRSQYDCYPQDAGLKLTPKDVDVSQHQFIKNTFLGGNGNDLLFFITAQETSGKTWLESQVYFPIAAFSLTKRGKLSCGYNKPPLADQTLTVLTADNILQPDQIKPQRALNNRAFFNEIDIQYNPDDSGNFQSQSSFLQADSYSSIGILSTLPINSLGVYGGYSASNLLKRAQFMLQRYGKAATLLQLLVNWEAGSVIDAGDTVVVQDDGKLQITNFSTGQRDLQTTLFEVIDRSLQIGTGNVQLKLLGNVGATVSDRFATISPSSIISAGSTSSQLIVQDSYGAIYPGNETEKWSNYIGLPIVVHSFDWSVSETTTLLSIDPINNYMLHVNPLGFTPSAGYIIDVPNYPTSVDPTVNQLYKAMHAFLDPSIAVVSGIDNRNFTVGAGDIGKFKVGDFIRVHSSDYTSDSGDQTVSGISGNQVTTTLSMGFTPSAGQLVELIGFADNGAAYRWI